MKGEAPREYDIIMIEREAGAPESVPAHLIMYGMGTRIKESESKAAGTPVHVDHPWIQILVPGEQNKSAPERPASETDMRRFPRSYDAVMRAHAKNGPGIHGMPIEGWAQITRSEAVTLRSANIPTVEALAEVQDGHIDKIGMRGRELRSMAKAFLEINKNAAAAQVYKAESDRKDLAIADLQRQFNELAARLEKPEDEEPKRGPGRPRKVQEDAA